MGTFDIGNNLPPPPVLGNIDPVKIEEIRRTIFVSNLDDSVSFYIHFSCCDTENIYKYI